MGQADDLVASELDRARVEAFDLRNPLEEFYDDPYPTYDALRRLDPVHLCPDGSYFLSRHADLHQVYRNPRLFRSDKKEQFRPMFGDSPLYEHHTTSLVFNDPPLHTHVRKAIGDALSQKMVAAMEPGLRALVARLLDELEERRELDFIQQFASVVPIEMICNLMNVPLDDRALLRRWANAILGALEFRVQEDRLALGNQCVVEAVAYLKDLIAERRKNLSDGADDIVSRLIRWESEGFRLSEHQLYHQCIFILNAGHETTTNLLGNGIHLLLEHPDERAKLLADPSLASSAVEEILRFESSVQLGNRQATEACEIGGVKIAAQTYLTLGIGAANRDPAAYVDPNRFDVTRNPRDHHAFAGGIHTCAGLNFARLQARVALPALIERFPDLRLNGAPVRDRRTRFRGFLALPMATS